MKTLKEVADVLKQAQDQQAIPLKTLVERTGLTAVTVRGVLTGAKDARLTTVMALADQCGLELLLVPKVVAASLATTQTETPHITSLVEMALTRSGERP